MSKTTINAGGNSEFVVASGDSLAVSNLGGGIAQIYYLIASANFPDAWQLQQSLNNSSVVLGPFTSDQRVRIIANNSRVLYESGASVSAASGDADTLDSLDSNQFLRKDSSDTVVSNANLQIGTGEGNVRMQHSSGNNAFFITPYDGGGYVGGKQVSFDADDGEWNIEGNPQIGAGVSGSFTTTDGKTVTVTKGVITNIV